MGLALVIIGMPSKRLASVSRYARRLGHGAMKHRITRSSIGKRRPGRRAIRRLAVKLRRHKPKVVTAKGRMSGGIRVVGEDIELLIREQESQRQAIAPSPVRRLA